MSLFTTLLTLTLFLAGCAPQDAPSPGIGHGEPLALHTADGFGPINNGFISQPTLGDWNGDGRLDLLVGAEKAGRSICSNAPISNGDVCRKKIYLMFYCVSQGA